MHLRDQGRSRQSAVCRATIEREVLYADGVAALGVKSDRSLSQFLDFVQFILRSFLARNRNLAFFVRRPHNRVVDQQSSADPPNSPAGVIV